MSMDVGWGLVSAYFDIFYLLLKRSRPQLSDRMVKVFNQEYKNNLQFQKNSMPKKCFPKKSASPLELSLLSHIKYKKPSYTTDLFSSPLIIYHHSQMNPKKR